MSILHLQFRSTGLRSKPPSLYWGFLLASRLSTKLSLFCLLYLCLFLICTCLGFLFCCSSVGADVMCLLCVFWGSHQIALSIFSVTCFGLGSYFLVWVPCLHLFFDAHVQGFCFVQFSRRGFDMPFVCILRFSLDTFSIFQCHMLQFGLLDSGVGPLCMCGCGLYGSLRVLVSSNRVSVLNELI